MSRSLSRRAVLAWGSGVAHAANAERPNILWITCEDLSPILGCYGDRYASTPHLHRLASQGVRFERAFAAAESALRCGPSSADSVVALNAAVACWYLGEQTRASTPALRRALAEKGGPEVQRSYARDAMRKTLERLG
jgi:hypothetical protein